VALEGPPAAFGPPPPGAAGPPAPWRLGDEDEVRAELLVDADQARWAVDALGPDAVTAHRPDGSLVFGVGVTNTAAFRSFVLGFLDHAEILGPAPLRAGMADWLTTLADPTGSDGHRA
jgi:predicted DNA-binding transcriptional regulator YafY